MVLGVKKGKIRDTQEGAAKTKGAGNTATVDAGVSSGEAAGCGQAGGLGPWPQRTGGRKPARPGRWQRSHGLWVCLCLQSASLALRWNFYLNHSWKALCSVSIKLSEAATSVSLYLCYYLWGFGLVPPPHLLQPTVGAQTTMSDLNSPELGPGKGAAGSSVTHRMHRGLAHNLVLQMTEAPSPLLQMRERKQ